MLLLYTYSIIIALTNLIIIIGSFNKRHLTLIKWNDASGTTQRFYLMDRISVKWRETGDLLELSAAQLQGIVTEHQGNQEACCRAILSKWMENPPCEYPVSWEGLIELLEDSRLSQVVKELKTALEETSQAR